STRQHQPRQGPRRHTAPRPDRPRRADRPPRTRPHHPPPARPMAPPARLAQPLPRRLRTAPAHGLTSPDQVHTSHAPHQAANPRPKTPPPPNRKRPKNHVPPPLARTTPNAKPARITSRIHTVDRGLGVLLARHLLGVVVDLAGDLVAQPDQRV